MKLTVLGRYGPFPAPGGACSGYLVESGDIALALDMGSGALSNLLRCKGDLSLSAVLLSHLHSDHMSDMLVLRYALKQLSARGRPVPFPLTVVAPDEPESEYRQLAASGVYDMVRARDNLRIRFGNMTISLHRTMHPVPTYSFFIEHEGRKLFYTGDTGYFPGLANFAQGADVLLADTCFLNSDKPSGAGIAPHLTAGEAGKLAREAGASQLICTHLWGGGDACYTAQILEQAQEMFPNVLIAEEMHEYQI
ncbi:MAG: MBL fold metallo-hydrolase [Christensenellaceae bacterium]|jgi:ribonuclease BN (tRNA processing enzyme)|nr:MBL fold metallo-hydrolase [Christensenellaceae bacterium]